LKPYANPIVVGDLHEGDVYFSVTFVDEKMLIPCIETLAFVEKKYNKNGVEEFLFQDIESYRQGVKFSLEYPVNFFICSTKELNSVFTLENALDVLMQCSLKNKG
jgi:hypothetical protein